MLRSIRKVNDTLLDLMVGCLIYSAFFELVGLIVVPDRVSWTLGMILGTLTALVLSISMYRGIVDCLSMDPMAARRSMTIQSILRLLVMLAAAWLGMKLSMVSFPAVIVGILGLKVSSHLHMYTSVYITERLRRKGR